MSVLSSELWIILPIPFSVRVDRTECALHFVSPAAGRGLTVSIVDNSLHFVKNFIRFVLKGLASHVYNSPTNLILFRDPRIL